MPVSDARPTPKQYYESHPAKPHIDGIDHYEELYNASVKQPEVFFANQARELLSWDRDFKSTHSGGFEFGDMSWFQEGTLNAAYNCVDRHAIATPNKVSNPFS